MMKKDLFKKLEKVSKEDGSSVFFDEPLAPHTTISVGGNAFLWIEPETVSGLRNIIGALSEEGLKRKIVGEGSNILFPDGKFEGVFIRLKGSEFTRVSFSRNLLTAGCGVKVSFLISECVKRGLSGLESLIGIPGTLGGALVMNASYKEAVSENLVKVLVMDSGGELKWVKREELKFSYRSSSFAKGDILIEAVFKLKEEDPERVKKRMKEYLSEKATEQPLDERSLGCVFKNPPDGDKSSWELIDGAGMRGASIGGARVSDKHANFIVNTGDARASDVRALIERIRESVSKKFSVKLEEEIEVL